MSKLAIKETPLFWPAAFNGRTLSVLDETALPQRRTFIKVKTVAEAVRVIRQMKTRAFGQLLVVCQTFLLELAVCRPTISDAALMKRLEKIADRLNASRPTFPFAEVTAMILSWGYKALEQGQDVRQSLTRGVNGYLAGVRQARLDRVRRLAEILKDGDSVLTHCNVSGELAMAVELCRLQNKKLTVFACETRPYLQGAKLTTWDLKYFGLDVILVADNAIGSLLADQMVNKVVVGSDRNCANGDFANKIGTYSLAVLAKEFSVPFYVLTQPSTKVKQGADIPVEIRDEKELLRFEGKRIFPKGVKGFYPGFDVIPNKYVTKAIPIHV